MRHHEPILSAVAYRVKSISAQLHIALINSAQLHIALNKSQRCYIKHRINLSADKVCPCRICHKSRETEPLKSQRGSKKKRGR